MCNKVELLQCILVGFILAKGGSKDVAVIDADQSSCCLDGSYKTACFRTYCELEGAADGAGWLQHPQRPVVSAIVLFVLSAPLEVGSEHRMAGSQINHCTVYFMKGDAISPVKNDEVGSG